MGFGEHWEWRGFGRPPAGLRSRILSLRAKFPAPQELLDEYLWAPGGRVNIKLRESSLKFKRCLERAGGLERWIEDEAENHSFPLDRPVIEKLLRDLALDPGEVAGGARDRREILDRLREQAPGVRLIAVRKKRWQMEWAAPAATIELAEIYAPESITSIGIEDPDRRRVEGVRDALGLPGELRELSYLDVLSIWARGARIEARPADPA